VAPRAASLRSAGAAAAVIGGLRTVAGTQAGPHWAPPHRMALVLHLPPSRSLGRASSLGCTLAALRAQHLRGQTPRCRRGSVALSGWFSQEPQTITVLGPKMSPHPKSVLCCVWRKRLNVDGQPSEAASLSLWASPRSYGEELHSYLIQVEGYLGQRPASEGGIAFGVCGPILLYVREELQMEGRVLSLTLRKPSQGYLLVERMCF